MLKQRGFKRRENDAAGSYSLDRLPPIDRNRVIAVYVRQSHRDADDKNGESRMTQLELAKFAQLLVDEGTNKVNVYDEKAGKSGQKRIDERTELERLYRDMDKGIVGTIIVSREDRLFRDRHGAQSGTFTEKAEKMKTVVIVPLLGPTGKMRYYDFSDYEHLRKFQEKMRVAYDYIATHVAYMNLNQHNKSARGCYDGRTLPPGLVVPRNAEKMEQRPVFYAPWAEKMRWIYARWKELDYSIPKITREIERLPYLFPTPTEEDYGIYMFRTTLTRCTGGFKPASASTIRRWFENVHLMGWWPIDDGGEVIVDNHEAVIDKDTFERGYIHLTGYNLDGILIPDARNTKKIQVRRSRETPIEALLHGNPNFTALHSDSITVTDIGDGHTPRYMGRVRKEGSIYKDNSFAIPCTYIDQVIAQRLEVLSEGDKTLAERIQKNLQDIQARQAGECISINDQLARLQESLQTGRKRLARLTIALEDTLENEEMLDELTLKIQDMDAQRNQLLEKKKQLQSIKGNEEIQKFYTTLANFKRDWSSLQLEQKQRLIRLLTNKIEIALLSTHWLRLTVHWIGPVCVRPDVAFIWRAHGARTEVLEEWEKDILKQMYPTCVDRTELLKLIPSRSWYALSMAAKRLGVNRELWIGKPHNKIHAAVAWDDIKVIPDTDKAIQMASHAARICQKENQATFTYWLLDASLDSVKHSLEETLSNHSNTDDLDPDGNAAWCMLVRISPGSTQ